MIAAVLSGLATAPISHSYPCPEWAFDPANRGLRPRTGGRWQPIWWPKTHREPLPGYETDVATVLTNLEISWIYEPLMVPIRLHQNLADPNLKRRRKRRFLVPDFYLPDYDCFIEVYEGASPHSRHTKHRRLIRMSRLHHKRFLLITREDEFILRDHPELLLEWLESLPNP